MRPFTLSLLAVAVVLPACHKAPPPPPAPDPAPAAVTDDGAQARAEAARRAREDSVARARAAEEAARRRAEAARLLAALRDTLTAPVHFDFDQAALRSDDQASMDRKLAILVANPELTVRIAGHADERGSDEYNLALGARRAATVSAWLRSHGVPAARLEVVSYGEERPAATGQDEWSWARNRRAELEPLAGADTLVSPAGGR